MDDTLEQLAQYILQEIRQGVPDAQIRKTLADNGWAPPAIDGAFGIVQHYTSHPLLPQPSTNQQPDHSQPVEPLHAARFPEIPTMRPVSAAPATNTYVATRSKGKRSKKLLLALLVVLLFAGIGTGTVVFIQKHDASKQSKKPVSTQQQAQSTQQKIDPDTTRKDNLNILLTNLSDFYIANHTYPTLGNLNDAAFLQKQTGFNVAAFADPAWSKADAACTGQNGKPTLATGPAAHCFAYVSLTSGGSACDAATTVCTKLSVTAVLKDGTPYTVSLDQNHVAN
jgi:hypothetical protein